MKLSEIPRRPVMIMCGISGSGKTYNALRLEAEGYIRVSVDNIIWRNFGSSLDSLSDSDKRKAFMEANEQARMETESLIARGKKVVVDATHCKRIARDEIRRLCGKYGISPRFIYLSGSKEILWSRLSQRKGEGPDDLPVTREQLDDYFIGFQRPQPDETDIVTLES